MLLTLCRGTAQHNQESRSAGEQDTGCLLRERGVRVCCCWWQLWSLHTRPGKRELRSSSQQCIAMVVLPPSWPFCATNLLFVIFRRAFDPRRQVAKTGQETGLHALSMVADGRVAAIDKSGPGLSEIVCESVVALNCRPVCARSQMHSTQLNFTASCAHTSAHATPTMSLSSTNATQ